MKVCASEEEGDEAEGDGCRVRPRVLGRSANIS